MGEFLLKQDQLKVKYKINICILFENITFVWTILELGRKKQAFYIIYFTDNLFILLVCFSCNF